MIAYNAYQLWSNLRDGLDTEVVRGQRYDLLPYGPVTIKTGTTLRCLDGGSDTAIIEYSKCIPEQPWTGGGFLEELFQVEDDVIIRGITLDMGQHASNLDPGMMQCGIRVLGTHCTFEDFHVTNCLKWGGELVQNVGHKFTDASFTNITYRLTSDPNPFTGFGYGMWMSGTNDGVPPSSEDITVFELCHFDNVRNGLDCSQAGNSYRVLGSRFGFCAQSGIDTHESYGVHDLEIDACMFRGKDQHANFRIHKLTGHLIITNNLSAESTFYFGEQVGFPGWPGSIVEPDPIETDRMTIHSNVWRYNF